MIIKIPSRKQINIVPQGGGENGTGSRHLDVLQIIPGLLISALDSLCERSCECRCYCLTFWGASLLDGFLGSTPTGCTGQPLFLIGLICSHTLVNYVRRWS
jgi:hypothetical protein